MDKESPDPTNGLKKGLVPKKLQKRMISPSAFRKSCDICGEPNDVLVRCQIDTTATWHFVCPKRCWKGVSGAVTDGSPDHPNYRYGGMWKNKHAFVSAKKPRHRKGTAAVVWQGSGVEHVANEMVQHEGKVWICRRSHQSGEENNPAKAFRLWKEAN